MTAVTPGARPADLVPGDPDELDRLSVRLGRFAVTAGDAATKLGTLDADVWTGESAEVFRCAIGDVPTRLERAAGAFGAAARALSAYARVLREGQATAAGAVKQVERATPETLAAEQRAAAALVARATAEVEAAGRLAAQRLARAEGDAPHGDDVVPQPLGLGMTLQVGAEHQLTDPDGYVSPPGDWGGSVADMRYTSPHDVAFAGAAAGGDASTGGDTGWAGWAAAGSDRTLGVVEPGTVAAAGSTVAAVLMIGRRRRESTALGLAGLDEAELRRRRDEFGGARHRDAEAWPAPTARLGDAGTWRTRLVPTTRATGTVPVWTGSGADLLVRSRVGQSIGSVDRDVRGAVLRTGRPAHEGS